MANLNLTDDRDFPSLSNNPQMAGTNQPSSMWNNSQPARHLGGPQRNPSAPIPPAVQQDDPFSPGSRLSSSQNSFRYGSQASMGQPQQPQPTGGEEFPPLARNGDIGQERNANLASAMGALSFGSQAAVASSSSQPSRSGNGLLNAVTAQARTAEARSPVGMYRCSGVDVAVLNGAQVHVLSMAVSPTPRKTPAVRPPSVKMALSPLQAFQTLQDPPQLLAIP